MAYVHLFNPENDLALAANTDCYTPPRAAVKLARAGALLPLWYGDSGDMAMCYGVSARWYDAVCEAFGIDVGLYPHSPAGLDVEASPWGWSRAARRVYVDDGFRPEALPTDAQLDAMRNLSHRRTASALALDLIEGGITGIAEPAVEVADGETLALMLGDGAAHVLKMPWSSSGRGVVDTRSVGIERGLKFGLDCIRRQGSVMVERAYDRIMDFAKLYECRDGKCAAIGTSVFATDSRGAYTGNLLADEAERRRRVGEMVDLGLLDTVTEALRQSIERRIAPNYSGVLGVDMLVDKSRMLDACVEVNLRKTMGYVANRIADRYLAPGCTGAFSVAPRRSGESDAMAQAPTIERGRLAAGVMQLVPDNPDFSISARIDG